MPPVPPQPNLHLGGGASGLSLRFWALALLTGVGAGLGGGGLMLLLRAVQHLAWTYRTGTFLAAVERTGSAQRIAVLVGVGVIVGLYRCLTKSNTGGHGGELAEAIWFHSGYVAALATSIKAVLSIFIVGLGASLGREAAPKQLGAVVASVLAGWGRLSPPERRLLAACGAGGGVAAVYNVPFGGALFALEVLLGTLALPLVLPALTGR
jgi:chloride channel protein, CIC family